MSSGNREGAGGCACRLILGIAVGLLAHQVFGLTDALMLGTKPGIVM